MRGSEIDIVQRRTTSLYRTQEDRQIISYKRELPDCIVHGLQCEEGKKRKRGSPMYLRSEVKSERNMASLLCAAHLMPFFGWEEVLWNPYPSESLDVYAQFYVNKYADHQAFKLL